MKANELRIGNLVLNDDSIEEVTLQHLDLLVHDNTYFKPIPLTEEWLLKFGFENLGEIKEVSNRYVLFNVIDGTSNFELYEYGNEYDACIDDNSIYIHELKYVHQLQNLYFALTGKEL